MADTDHTDRQPVNEDTANESDDLQPLAVDGELPLKAVGIENLKEANPQHMPPHRYLHPWFARRPTPASRLAILASVLPEGIDTDKLLRWMQIGPKETLDMPISEYVERKKASESTRDGKFSEHYGYERPYKSTPTPDELDNLHETLRDTWDGELPAVLDPTAGGGVIPFEALRYGLPTTANELNPVPSVMLRVMLDYAPSVGSIGSEVRKWAKIIDDDATKELAEYFPSSRADRTPSHYATTYTITCESCGTDIPLVKKWWLRKTSASKGIAARPRVAEDGSIEYDCVTLPDDVTKSEFDPQDGPNSGRGGADCLNCPVLTDADDIEAALRDGDYEVEVYGVKYEVDGAGSGYRAPTRGDQEALDAAAERVDDDFDLVTLLSVKRYIGEEDRAGPKGVTEWRDAFTPRQLLTHYEYLQAFEDHKDDIHDQYNDETAEAILSILALISSKSVDRNIRFAPYDSSKGYPANTSGGKHITLLWSFVDNNLAAGDQCYADNVNRVVDSYEHLVSYLNDVDPDPAQLYAMDASHLPIKDEEIQAVVIDPPYYDSIIYSELADMFYVWLKEYLDDVHPSLFQDELTNKRDEAVANSAEFAGLTSGDESKKDLANRDYEEKMSNIFSEMYRVLDPGGVMTVMFTHKETDAWDTLAMSLVNAGFTITATHPITSEMPQRTDTRHGGSAETTLLLSGRKPQTPPTVDQEPALWSEVRKETQATAKAEARELLESGLSLTKTDIIVAAFGPTLRVYADNYPVVDKKDETVPPREALKLARTAVTQVLADRYLNADQFDDLDELTRWYILSWLVYERDNFPYDEALQLGRGVGVDIDDIKRDTKVWESGRKQGDIRIKSHNERVQDITKLEAGEDVSSVKFPVDPTRQSFTYTLDAVHAALHVYEKQGGDAAWDWLTERNYQSNPRFKTTLTALLQVLPEDHDSATVGRDIISGRTGDLLNISPKDLTTNTERDTKETKLGEYVE